MIKLFGKSPQISLALMTGILLPLQEALATPFGGLEIRNPTPYVTVEELIVGILNVLTIVAIPLIVLMIIYGGFLYVTARGNADQIRKANTTLTFAIIGGILVIAAVAITGIIESTVQDFRS
jgi:hypothetical protein